jgi:hypothetical protein
MKKGQNMANFLTCIRTHEYVLKNSEYIRLTISTFNYIIHGMTNLKTNKSEVTVM